MSKSLGNVISPDDILKKYGVDILRLWVVASDYYDDLKLDNAILQAQTDSYRRIRNTFRYIIGNLDGFGNSEKIDESEFPDLEQYILHRLWEIDQIISDCVKNFNFHLMFTTLLNFCSNDLSAFYFDIRKDVIYCDGDKSKIRRSARTLLEIIFNYLVRWLAPSLSFTTEEAWKAMGNQTSIHLEDFLHTPAKYENLSINENWKIIKQIRKVITGALEKRRAEKLIGSSLEAHVDIYVDGKTLEKIKNYSFDEISITSSFSLHVLTDESKGYSLEDVADIKIAVSKTNGQKCQRCWNYKEQLIRNEICERCDNAIA